MLEWSGKQDEITSENKLDADLVDDAESTNKFVTAQEKETWNAKQNAIDSSHKLSSDLVDDTNHTHKFVTSSEKETWNGKQDALTFDNIPTSGSDNPVKSGGIYTELAGKVNTSDIIPSSQGIPASPTDITVPSMKLVADTYVPNSSLVEVINDGAKNKLNLTDGTYTTSNASTNNSTFTISSGTITVTACTTNDTRQITIGSITLDAGTYVLADRNFMDGSSSKGDIRFYYDGNFYPSSGNEFTINARTTFDIRLYTYGTTALNKSITPMLCTKSQFGISPEYEPYALGNQYLTPELIELCDSGAKNLSQWSGGTAASDGATIAQLIPIDVNGGGIFMVRYDTTLTSGIITIGFKNSSGTNVVTLEINNNMKEKQVTLPSTVTQFSMVSSKAGTISNFMICTLAAWNVSHKYVPYRPNWDLVSSVSPFYSVPINHNMIYRGQNLGASLTDAQHTALSSGNFTDLFLGDYWTKTVTIPAGTYTGGDGEEVTVPAQTNITLKAVIADFDTFYAGYASTYAGINTHHAAVIVTGFSNVVWNKTNSTAGGYVASLIHKWLVGSALPQIETWFGSAKVLAHQKLLTNAITGDAASGWAWSSQKISLLSECQLYGMKVWGGSKATNGAYEPGEAFKKLDVFNHIDANLLFGNKGIWCRDIASAVAAASLNDRGSAIYNVASYAGIVPAALILLS